MLTENDKQLIATLNKLPIDYWDFERMTLKSIRMGYTIILQ